MRCGILIAVVICAVLAVSSEARGDTIQNGSFEEPDVAWPDYALVTPTGWTWNGLGRRGVVQEGYVDMPVSTHGDQWGIIQRGAALSQLIGSGTLQANTTYEFSFYQFEQTNMGDKGSALQLEIWESDPFTSGGSALDSVVFASTGHGIMEQRFASLNSGASAASGGDLYLVLRAITDPTGGRDNVAIDELVIGRFNSPVPEPTTLALFGLGVAGLALARRRRRAS